MLPPSVGAGCREARGRAAGCVGSTSGNSTNDPLLMVPPFRPLASLTRTSERDFCQFSEGKIGAGLGLLVVVAPQLSDRPSHVSRE